VLLCAAALLCSGAANVGAAEGPSSGSIAASSCPVASDARLAGDSKRTRFVLDLDKSIQFSRLCTRRSRTGWWWIFLRSVFNSLQKPASPGAVWSRHSAMGLVMPGGSRIVFRSDGPARIAKSYVLERLTINPPRLVLELGEEIDRTISSSRSPSKAGRSCGRASRMLQTHRRHEGPRPSPSPQDAMDLRPVW